MMDIITRKKYTGTMNEWSLMDSDDIMEKFNSWEQRQNLTEVLWYGR